MTIESINGISPQRLVYYDREIHIILSCPLYNDIRDPLLVKANDSHSNFNDQEEIIFHIDHEYIVRNTTKCLLLNLQRRIRFVYIND